MEKKNPKSVLFINLYTQMGGGEYSLLHLMKSLDKDQFSPILLLPEEGPFAEKARSNGIAVKLIKFRPAILLKLFNPIILNAELKAARQLSQFIFSEDIQLIHCTDILSLLLLIPAWLRCRIHIFYNLILFPSPFQCLLLNFLTSFMLRSIVATSQAVKAHLLKYTIGLEPKVSVMYNGVDASLFRPMIENEKRAVREKHGLPAGKKVVGLLGRYEVWKGHQTFLQAAELLLAKRTDLLFIVIGGAITGEIVPAVRKYRADFLESVHRSPINDHFLLWDHRDDIFRVIHCLDVVVCPSEQEAFGLIVLEAYASNIPVVVSNTVGALEVLKGEKGIWIAEADSVKAFTKQIELALSDSSELIPNKQKLDELSWKNYASQWEKIYLS
ncbi:MAG: glycosyltransferase family 4 protein [bacterium]